MSGCPIVTTLSPFGNESSWMNVLVLFLIFLGTHSNCDIILSQGTPSTQFGSAQCATAFQMNSEKSNKQLCWGGTFNALNNIMTLTIKKQSVISSSSVFDLGIFCTASDFPAGTERVIWWRWEDRLNRRRKKKKKKFTQLKIKWCLLPWELNVN